MILSNRTKNFFCLLLVVISLSPLSGCTFAKRCFSVLRSTDNFISHQSDQRVLFEPGADDYADIIVSLLPTAIKQVEERQYRQFAKPVRVYICASRESFIKMASVDVPAIVVIKLFLSPKLFDENNEIINMYLMHELSHLHIRDQLGSYQMSRLPFWFKEGLAVYVSDGGGTHTVTLDEAEKLIKAGKHFVPNTTGGFIFQNNHNDWNLKPQMFYLQSKMFISYLVASNNSAFKQLIVSILDGNNFKKSIEKSYNNNLETLWESF